MNCAQCGTPAAPNARFCSNCGAALVAPRPVEGERKLVTVLFADVVGSTAMAEALDPEQISEIMAGAFAFMNQAVARYGGTVSRLMGDAVLALFGAPTTHEDDPERAVRAALDIQEAARRYEHTVRRAYGVDFAVRIGIHTGLAILGTVGDQIKAEYTAMGDTPNVAARVQAAAKPGTVLITAATLRHVRDLVDVEGGHLIQAKGKAEPVEVHAVRGVKEAPRRGHGVAGLRSPLVGRDAEKRALLDAIGAARRGAGAFVALIAEAGLGKSRLLEEVRAACPPEVPWLEGRAASYGQAMVHHLWRDLFRAWLGATPAEPPATTRSRLGAALSALGLDGDARHALEALLGVPGEATAARLADLDDDSFDRLVVDALVAWLDARGRGTGVVLVFDDLHWADTGSLALIEALAARTVGGSVTTIATLRPERASAGWAAVERLRAALPGFRALELQPLDPASTRQLLDNLLRIDDLPSATRDLVLQRSDGNPFFVEEVLGALIDAGHLVPHEGGWRAHPDITSVAIPETLSGVLTARIDRLPERARRVIQTASVIGRNFPYPVLAQVCDDAQDPERIDDPAPQLRTLTEEGLVRELTRRMDADYAFKHALTQEAAYALLLLRRRRDLHRRTAQALEAFYGDRATEVAPVLARHFFEGEDWRNAASYAAEGAAQAQQVFRSAQALDLWDIACRAHDRAPDAPLPEVADAILAWAEQAFKVRPREEILARLQTAERIARESGDEARLARTLNWIGNAHILSGFPFDGVPALSEALEIARRIGDEEGVMLPMFLTTTSLVDEDPAGALPKLDDVIAAARRFKDRDVEAHTLAAKAEALARLGRFDEARATIDAALAVVPLTHSPVKDADVNAYASAVHLLMGDFETASRHGRTAAELAYSVGGLGCAASGHMHHGRARFEAGENDAARAAFESADALILPEWPPVFRNRVHGWVALARLQAGEIDARPDAVRALETARQLDDTSIAADFADALGRIDLRDGRLDEAARHLGAAAAWYRAKGMQPLLDRASEALARVHERRGDGAAAAQPRA